MKKSIVGLAFATVMILAVASVPLLALGDNGRAVTSTGPSANSGNMTSAVEFHDDWRYLWEDHVWYTREAVIDILTASNSTNATVDRLLQVAADTREMMRPFYGDQVDDFYTELVGHFTIAAQIVAGVRDGENVTGLVGDWFTNAQNMTEIMNGMNPMHWRTGEVNAMWNDHLNLTIQEALQYNEGQFNESIATFDEIEDQGVMMGDMFSNGIMCQFPEQFCGMNCLPDNSST